MARVEYDISRPAGECSACQKALESGQEFVATVIEGAGSLDRRDFCLDCWAGQKDDATNLLGVWRSRVPEGKKKKKLLIDNELLINFFERLDGAVADAKISFRFVLALILMRKKLLVYDRSDSGDNGCDVWTMHLKGADRKYQVVDPHMDEERIAQVSEQLGQILEGDL